MFIMALMLRFQNLIFLIQGKMLILDRVFIRHLFMNRLKNGAGSSKTEEWLDFILNCRRGMDSSEYDIVMGGVANDKVFNTVELFFDGLIDKMEAIKRLKYEKPNFQIAFRTSMVLERYLHFEGSEQL